MIIIRPVTVTDAILTSSSAAETDEAEFNIGTSYALGDRVMVTTVGTHSIYVSLQAGNTGNQPQDDDLIAPVFWARESATNKWAMFSDQISDQTELSNEIIIVLTPSALINGLSFFNIDAQEITIVMDDPGDGEVYNETFTMIDAAGINNWWSWYFEPITRQSTLAVLDLPPFANATITVTITNTGGVAKCGLLSIGSQQMLGDALHGTGIGIIDYSRKERDTFGNPVVVERNFSKRTSYIVRVDTSYASAVQNILANFRTTPLTYIGDVNIPGTIVYGFYKDFNTILSNPSTSLLSLNVEGLT